MKRAPRSRQRHDLYAKYDHYDSEISDLLEKCRVRGFAMVAMRDKPPRHRFRLVHFTERPVSRFFAGLVDRLEAQGAGGCGRRKCCAIVIISSACASDMAILSCQVL